MTDLLLRDVAVLDCTGREPTGRHDVLIQGRRIAAIRPTGRATPPRVATINGAGCTLLPGLTDGHVHLALIGKNGDHGTGPWVSHVLRVARYLEAALEEGFTTVRDAVASTRRGAVRSGTVWSEGPGQVRCFRRRGDTVTSGSSTSNSTAPPRFPVSLHGRRWSTGLTRFDAPDEVRRAVREQLRRGASQIKVLASGGIVSPTDPFDSVQFSAEELATAVEAAANHGT